jgi:glycosyltransferase involved in cell wall biosynthesis
MKLLFLTDATIRFNAATPLHEPLGGTESASAYLTAQLAANGHDVTLMAALPGGTPERLLGVRHIPYDGLPGAEFFAREAFDAVITIGAPGLAAGLKASAPGAFHVHWLHALPDQPGMQPLRGAAAFIDCAVFVSDSHRRMTGYPGAARAIGNGIAPAFENLFASAAELLAAKQNRAAYTSTPFRGLNVLRQSFAEAGKDGGLDTELDLYTGMRLYQQDEDQFAALYAAVRATPRCHLHGALVQADLARRLKRNAFLFYPCTYPETYCIAAVEAIAAGLKVVSTQLGALPETTLGYADLLKLPPGTDLVGLAKLFMAPMRAAEADFLARPDAWAEERFSQSQAVNRLCSWKARAKEWEVLLEPAVAAKRA